MKIGQKVYTINAKTNGVDEWTYDGKIEIRNGASVVILRKGNKTCTLPRRCVFSTRKKAVETAKNFLS